MTNETMISQFGIKDLERVCAVSNAIHQVCQLRGFDWLERILMSQWLKRVIEKQNLDSQIGFTLAKYSFVRYLRSDDNTALDDPITEFLIKLVELVPSQHI